MLFLTALSTKLHRTNSSGYETNRQRSTKADRGEFQALPSDFCRAGCIYPKMEEFIRYNNHKMDEGFSGILEVSKHQVLFLMEYFFIKITVSTANNDRI